METKQRSVLGWAQLYVSRGFPVIPLRPREKRPHGKLLAAVGWLKEDGRPTWEPARERLPTDEELETWFAGKSPEEVGIGLVIPGGVAVVDLEGPEPFSLFFNGSIEEIAQFTWVVKTGKGYHVYLRLPRSCKPVKVEGWVEIRTNGLLVTAPPSIHPSGRPYTWLSDPERTPIGRVDEEALQRLLKKVEMARWWKRFVEAVVPAWTPSQRHHLAGPLAGYLRKRGIPQEEAEFIVKAIALLAGDEEVEDRLRFVRDTYEKPLNEVKGLSGLRELLDEETVEAIRRALPKRPEEEERGFDWEFDIDPDELKAELAHEDLWSRVVKAASRLVKKDARSVIYAHATMLSSELPSPLNMANVAPSSEGKTYPILSVAELYPRDKILILIGASERSFIYDHGELVDEEGRPIADQIAALRARIDATKDKSEKEALTREFVDLLSHSRRLVDLDGKILLFLEKPDDALLARLRPHLSRDAYETEYRFVEKKGGRLRTEKILIRGWPVVIFCKTEEEEFPRWLEDQIRTRFLTISPQTGPEKYREANALSSDRFGLPGPAFEAKYQTKELEEVRARLTLVLRELNRRKKLVKPGQSFFWIPFRNQIARAFPADKGRHMRDIKAFLTLVQAVAATNVFARPTLKVGDAESIIVLPKDFETALRVYESTLETAMTGLSENTVQFFKKLKERFGSSEFTLTEVSTELGYPRSSADYYLRKLLDVKAVERRENPERRGSYLWRMVREDLIPPFIEEMREAVRSFTKEDLEEDFRAIVQAAEARGEAVTILSHDGRDITVDELWQSYFGQSIGVGEGGGPSDIKECPTEPIDPLTRLLDDQKGERSEERVCPICPTGTPSNIGAPGAAAPPTSWNGGPVGQNLRPTRGPEIESEAREGIASSLIGSVGQYHSNDGPVEGPVVENCPEMSNGPGGARRGPISIPTAGPKKQGRAPFGGPTGECPTEPLSPRGPFPDFELVDVCHVCLKNLQEDQSVEVHFTGQRPGGICEMCGERGAVVRVRYRVKPEREEGGGEE